MSKFAAILVLAVGIALVGSHLAHAQGTCTMTKSKTPNIVETAVAAGQFNTLAAALKAAGLVEALQGEGPFTVFAPTDEAFKKLPRGTVETLLKPENKKKLAAILKYHVVKGKVMASDVVKLDKADSLLGPAIPIEVKSGKVMAAGAKVTATDIKTSNGVIHVIDSVMLPKDIVETAVAAGKFETLAAALGAAGLVEALQGEGPFTVFAPTDEAFAKLPEGTVESLLKPENKDQLTAILTYHVVPGKVMAKEVVGLSEATTLQGSNVSIELNGETVMIDNAKVVATDIQATNGVIHVIDSVILPN